MLEKINYKDIECSGVLTTEAIDQIKEMLTITDENNLLYICHPRHIFEKLQEDRTTKTITNVDWNSINTNLMKYYDDYGKFSILNQFYDSNNNQFAYLGKRFSNMLKKYREKGKENLVYPLAVIEEVHNKNKKEKYYVARGIICAKQTGILVCNKAKNKESLKVWQKSLFY